MRKILLLSLITLFTLNVFEKKKEKDYTEVFNLIEVWLEAQKDYEQLPGISAIVLEDQKVLWSDGFGFANPEKGVKTSDKTIHSICSISKLFTAVAIMKLYDEGKLRLDDPVKDHLAWFNLPQKYEASGPITIRALLTHSSGLPRESAHPYWTSPDFPFPSMDEIRKGLKSQETLYPAFTYFQYSNLGLSLLGAIVTEVSGQEFDDYVKTNILDPLKMNDTRTFLPKDQYGSDLAIGYSSKNRKGKRDKVKFFQANGIKGAAGFSSNVIDLGKFASWQFRLYLSDKVEILKPSTLKNMHNVHWTDPDFNTTWGLGFAVWKGDDGMKRVSHGGNCPGYKSALLINPSKKMAFSVMINANGTNPSKYIKGIEKIINKYPFNSKKITKVDLLQYEGHYSQQPWWGESYVTKWGDKIVVLDLPADNPANNMTLYKHIERDKFRRLRKNKKLGEVLEFIRDKNGKIVSYKQHGNFYKKMKQ